MKLERTLIELETMVDYGIEFLLKMKDEFDYGIEAGRDMVCDLSLSEFMELNGFSDYDLLDDIDDNILIDKINDRGIGIGEIYDEEDIVGWCQRNLNVEDMVEWR